MSKGAYIGVDGVARKIKKGYIGVDGVARKIKKAYIGIGGVARPCWSGGLSYFGVLSANGSFEESFHGGAWFGSSMCATSIDEFAFFAGGSYSKKYDTIAAPQTELSNKVYAFDSNLIRNENAPTVQPARGIGATSLNGYALFAGGNNDYDHNSLWINSVYAIDADLVRTSLEKLNYKRGYVAAVTAGEKAYFAGGYQYGGFFDYIDIYNADLTKAVFDSTGVESVYIGTNIGPYAMFISAMRSFGNGEIFILDGSTQVEHSLSFSSPFGNASAITIGDYALIAGGNTSSTAFSKSIRAITSDLTSIKYATSLSVAREYIASAVVGDFVIFGGGRNANGDVNTVDIYDKDLTKVIDEEIVLSESAQYVATSIGKYALFATGNTIDVISL